MKRVVTVVLAGLLVATICSSLALWWLGRWVIGMVWLAQLAH